MAVVLFEHRQLVGVFDAVGVVPEEIVDAGAGAAVRLGVHQHADFGLADAVHQRLPARAVGHVFGVGDELVEGLLCFIDAAQLAEQLGALEAGGERRLAVAIAVRGARDLVQPRDGAGIVVFFLGHLRQPLIAGLGAQRGGLGGLRDVFLQIALGGIVLPLLQVQQAQRQRDARVVRGDLPDGFELRARLVVLIVDQVQAGQREVPVEGGWSRLQERAQAGDGGVGIAVGAQLGGEDGGIFIAGTQPERGVEFGQRAGVVLGGHLGAGQCQVRLRPLRVVHGQALQGGNGADRVIALGHLLLQLQDGIGALPGRYLVQLCLQHRLDFAPLARGHHQQLLHLARRHRGGGEFDPQPCGRQRLRGGAGQEGDLGGALGEARVARVLCEAEIGAVGRLDQAALQRYLGCQHAVHDVFGERHGRQVGAFACQQIAARPGPFELDRRAAAAAVGRSRLGRPRGRGHCPCRQARQSRREQRGQQERPAARKTPGTLRRGRAGKGVRHGQKTPDSVRPIVA